MNGNGIEVYSRQSDNIGEGPVWSAAEAALFWIDIGRKRLYRKGPRDAQPKSWSLPHYPGCLGELSPGSVAVAMGEGVYRFDMQTGSASLISRATPPLRAGTRCNDGKVDPKGRLWVGTMQNNFGPNGEPIPIERSDGTLYRFDTDGSVHVMEDNIGISNTLAWSPDCKRFYFGDSLSGRIFSYDFDLESGAIRNKRLFFETTGMGVPDGSAIDADGCLWNTRWGGGVVLRITPDGKVDRTLEMPVLCPTSCSFGGDKLDTLYITSATEGLSAEQLKERPLSGSVFAVHGVAQGAPVPAMKL